MNRLKWFALIMITIVSLIVEFNMHHEPHGWWSSVLAFWIYFGFIGCVLLIVFAKSIGKLFINKGEDYYDAE